MTELTEPDEEFGGTVNVELSDNASVVKFQAQIDDVTIEINYPIRQSFFLYNLLYSQLSYVIAESVLQALTALVEEAIEEAELNKEQES